MLSRDEDVKTIREALDKLVPGCEGGLADRGQSYRNALAALDRLAADPPQDARELAGRVYDNYGHGKNNAAALIVADRERVREACIAFIEHGDYELDSPEEFQECVTDLRAAIPGDKAAR